MNANEVTVSKDWDLVFLAQQVGFTFPYATNEDETTGDIIIRFSGRDYDNVVAAVENYPVAYLPHLQLATKKRIGEIGRGKASYFPFNGSQFPLDFTTECRLDGLCRYFERNPTFTEIHWDASGEGDFFTIPRDTAFAMFDAASQHMQAVFNKRKELTDRVMAAADINDVVFTEIEVNWPGDVVEEPTV